MAYVRETELLKKNSEISVVWKEKHVASFLLGSYVCVCA